MSDFFLDKNLIFLQKFWENQIHRYPLSEKMGLLGTYACNGGMFCYYKYIITILCTGILIFLDFLVIFFFIFFSCDPKNDNRYVLWCLGSHVYSIMNLEIIIS